MPFVILMFCPIVIAAIGGGLITDEIATRRNIGFALVAIATIFVAALILTDTFIAPGFYNPQP